jgi:hypothetical protein
MHRDREIRLLYPPVFLAAALSWAWHETRVRGASFHSHRWKDTLRTLQEALPEGTAQLLAWLAASGVVLLAFGFLIGAVGQFLLSLPGLLGGDPSGFEAVMTSKMRRKVWREHFGAHRRSIHGREAAIVAAFDHALLEPGLAAWIERRWNAFHTNANAALALGLAMGAVPASEALAPGATWWVWVGTVTVVFVLVSARAYADVRRMNDLLADSLPAWASAGGSRGRLHSLEPERRRLQRAASSWSPRH